MRELRQTEMNEKVDFKKSLDSYQAKRDQFRLLEIPQRQYLAIDGQGDPNTSVEFTEAIEALYPPAYTLKVREQKRTWARLRRAAA